MPSWLAVLGVGRLELAFAAIVVAIMVTFATQRLGELQSAGHQVAAKFQANQARAASSLDAAHCSISSAASGAASSPCHSPTPRSNP